MSLVHTLSEVFNFLLDSSIDPLVITDFMKEQTQSSEQFIKLNDDVTMCRNMGSTYELNFGKHRGKKFKHIPVSYLKWASVNVSDQGLREALMMYLSVLHGIHDLEIPQYKPSPSYTGGNSNVPYMGGNSNGGFPRNPSYIPNTNTGQTLWSQNQN